MPWCIFLYSNMSKVSQLLPQNESHAGEGFLAWSHFTLTCSLQGVLILKRCSHHQAPCDRFIFQICSQKDMLSSSQTLRLLILMWVSFIPICHWEILFFPVSYKQLGCTQFNCFPTSAPFFIRKGGCLFSCANSSFVRLWSKLVSWNEWFKSRSSQILCADLFRSRQRKW